MLYCKIILQIILPVSFSHGKLGPVYKSIGIPLKDISLICEELRPRPPSCPVRPLGALGICQLHCVIPHSRLTVPRVTPAADPPPDGFISVELTPSVRPVTPIRVPPPEPPPPVLSARCAVVTSRNFLGMIVGLIHQVILYPGQYGEICAKASGDWPMGTHCQDCRYLP